MNPPSEQPNSIATWVDVLRWHASQIPDQRAYAFLPHGIEIEHSLTYGELDRRARAIAVQLQSLRILGERALLLYPPGLDYITAFMGCLYAGVVAVPAYPPQSSRAKRALPRLRSIVLDAQPAVILTLASLTGPSADLLAQIPGFGKRHWLATDTIADAVAENWKEPSIQPGTLAFLQYTSGSTADPKGVMVTHHNLLKNEAIVSRAFAHTDKSIVVGWLPLYHDMGLIGNVLQPMYRGIFCALMPPVAFLQNPVRWLSAISRFRATTSGGPNFAFELCVQKISPADLSNLDLSCWQVAFNGSEPVRAETMERFTVAFQPCGFRPETFYPCYGLAEATLIASGGKPSLPPEIRSFSSEALEQGRVSEASRSDPKVRTLVGCGQSFPGHKIAIVDPDSLSECIPGKIGEIWITGECVAQGYWRQKEQTTAVFQAYRSDEKDIPYLRSGDLGFILRGELFITGRLKDLIIIRGRNHYPQDIELTVETSHPALRRGCTAAFSFDKEGEERLVIAQEVERQHRNSDLEPLVRAIREAIAERHELNAYAVVLLKPGTIPKTSSGKIQRHACKLGFLQNSLDVLRGDVADDASHGISEKEFPFNEIAAAGNAVGPEFLRYVAAEVARILKIDSRLLNPERSLGSYGFDSLMAVELICRIERELGVVVPMVQVFETASLSEFVAYLVRQKETIASNAPGNRTVPGREKENLLNSPRIQREMESERTFPASPQQRFLWLLHESREDSSQAYTILVAIRLKGALQRDALEQGLEEILRRHEILRSTYFMNEGQLTQVVAALPPLILPVADLTNLSPSKQEIETRHLAALQAKCPFDLALGPVFRPVLYRWSTEEHVLTLTIHHIAADGWSVQIILEDLAVFYRAFSSGTTPPLPSLPLQYADFVEERNRTSDVEAARDSLAYWRQKLGGHLPELRLPAIHLRRRIQSFRSAQELFVIPVATVQALRALSQKEEVTPFMLLLAVFKVLLSRCSGQLDLVIGSSAANRNCASSQRLPGPFTNAVALRTSLEGDPSFRQILARVRQTALEAYSHQDLPFDMLLKELKLTPKEGRSSPFEVVFLFQVFFNSTWEMNEVAAEMEEFDTGMSNFDLALMIYRKAEQWIGCLKYQTDLFDPDLIHELINSYESILDQVLRDPEIKLGRVEIPGRLDGQARTARVRDQQQTIAISASFTAELLEVPLNYWMRELDIPARVAFAPYHQIFQELLNPESLLSQNQNGVNILLLRFADWIRDIGGMGQARSLWEYLKKNVDDLLSALKTAVDRSAVPYLICVCPSENAKRTERQSIFQELENWLADASKTIKGVHVVGMDELFRVYPVSTLFDVHANELGHVPFNPQFFTALGTMIARKVHALRITAYKVIVLDCDQTLWKGVCGEDGPAGIEIDPPRKALQEFMVAQNRAGMLICLCSKNNERDVLAVFEQRTELPLKLEHIIARKINWNSKSENLKALSEELGIGLNAFIFLDDSPLECAEVRSAHPAVLTIQLPQESEFIPKFLQHLWVFDHLKTTEEDRQRTALYRQNVQREQFRRESISLEGFLTALNLQCEIYELGPEEISRAAQLTQRTNQFNTTTIRYSESEMRRLIHAKENECFVVKVRDRFGDYGLVGVMIAKENLGTLEVSSFLLSCRALGRRVEYEMLAYLGKLGQKRGTKQLAFSFVRSSKNQPALDFLERTTGAFCQPSSQSCCFRMPIEIAITAKSKFPRETPFPSKERFGAEPRDVVELRANSGILQRIATQFQDVIAIDAFINIQQQAKFAKTENYTAPVTPIEKMLTEIWREVLRLDLVGVHHNFFELGGDSLLGTVIISRIRKIFDLELALHVILEKPTIAQLAEVIEEELIGQSNAEEIAAAAQELNKLSDDEISRLLKEEERSFKPG